jgi:hypothetical protein
MVSKNFTPAAGCATSALREAQKSRTTEGSGGPAQAPLVVYPCPDSLGSEFAAFILNSHY